MESRVNRQMLESQAQRIANQYPQLYPIYLDGISCCLKYGQYKLDYRQGRYKPYCVFWKDWADRRVKGEYRSTAVIRSKSFRKLDNAVEFMVERG